MSGKRVMMAFAMLFAIPTQAEETPDMEMLEYLGNWETVNGEYIDPTELTAEDLEQVPKPQEANEK